MQAAMLLIPQFFLKDFDSLCIILHDHIRIRGIAAATAVLVEAIMEAVMTGAMACHCLSQTHVGWNISAQKDSIVDDRGWRLHDHVLSRILLSKGVDSRGHIDFDFKIVYVCLQFWKII